MLDVQRIIFQNIVTFQGIRLSPCVTWMNYSIMDKYCSMWICCGLFKEAFFHMAGMINNFYYGKAGQADYTPEQMPTTRIQLFFETLKVRFTGLFGMNLCYLLFCLPAIVWTVLTVQVLNAQAEAGASAELLSYISMYLLWMIPCLGLSGIGAPGLMYVLRNWARDDHAFAFSDFKDQIKANWKQGLLTGLLTGLVTFVCYVGFIFYQQQAATNFFFAMPQMLTLMLCVLCWMMNMIIYTMMVTYKVTYLQLIKNAAIITLARLPWAILIFAISILPGAALLVYAHPYLVMAIAILYLVIGFAFTGFVYASYSNACFDKYINANLEGAPLNRGLRDPSLEDQDDEEEDA